MACPMLKDSKRNACLDGYSIVMNPIVLLRFHGNPERLGLFVLVGFAEECTCWSRFPPFQGSGGITSVGLVGNDVGITCWVPGHDGFGCRRGASADS